MFPRQTSFPKGSLDSIIGHLNHTRNRVVWLRRLNHALTWSIAGLCLYAAGDIYVLSRPFSWPPLKTAVVSWKEEVPEEEFTQIDLARNVFKPFISSGEQIKKASLEMKDIKARYRIVGILLGDEPQVMIENHRTQETSFLRSGDKIEEALVETIHMNYITIQLKGQFFEMYS